jgi:uncharacterized membrane protein (DUF373 family)
MGTEREGSPRDDGWARIIPHFERYILVALVCLLMVVVAVSVLELGWMLVRDLMSFQRMLLDAEETFTLFGLFLVVIIGLELLTTLKMYIRDGSVQVQVVLEVALIAIAQKIIILNAYGANPLTLFGVSAIVLALAGAIWLMRSRR